MLNVVSPDRLTRKSIRRLLLPKQNSTGETRYPLDLEFSYYPTVLGEKLDEIFRPKLNVEIGAFDDRSIRNERHRPN